MDRSISLLEKKRLKFKPVVPRLLQDLRFITFQKEQKTEATGNKKEIEKHFPKTYGRSLIYARAGEGQLTRPLKVGVVLSGGQAAGGHNVIAGLFDALKSFHHESVLYGFLNGPIGVVEGKFEALSEDRISHVRNLGGFDLIGSGRTKIETEEQLSKSMSVFLKMGLDGVVIIGGDDSNTNAALLAEYCLSKGCATKVVGVPKTIDGDLKNDHVEVSFGFDTACKTYAEMIGNIERDARSAKKYTHFIKLMGRSASHIALECALLTRPNMTLIGEEIYEKKRTLQAITEEIADLIEQRKGDYGVILVPEGLIEFIPEIKELIEELNLLLSLKEKEVEPEEKLNRAFLSLSPKSKETLSYFPKDIQLQLLIDRDPHGNVAVSHIQSEKLLSFLVEMELKKREYVGQFNPIHHFFGYEGRSGFPSNFDATYCNALGIAAALLIKEGFTGYMSAISHLNKPPLEWGVCGVPITSLMNIEKRKGKRKPVIRKALVDLKGSVFKSFERVRERWKLEDHYLYPGPIQFGSEEEGSFENPLILKK